MWIGNVRGWLVNLLIRYLDTIQTSNICMRGSPGLPGRNGVNGHNGLPGRDGRDGAKGEKGVAGPQGTKGEAVQSVVAVDQRNWKQCVTKKQGGDFGQMMVSKKSYFVLTIITWQQFITTLQVMLSDRGHPRFWNLE